MFSYIQKLSPTAIILLTIVGCSLSGLLVSTAVFRYTQHVSEEVNSGRIDELRSEIVLRASNRYTKDAAARDQAEIINLLKDDLILTRLDELEIKIDMLKNVR